MTTDELRSLLETLNEVRQRKSALEKTEKLLVEQLKPMVDSKFDVLPKQPIVAGDLSLSRVEGVSRSISADLLLERGVAPEIISYSTKTSMYYQYRIREAK